MATATFSMPRGPHVESVIHIPILVLHCRFLSGDVGTSDFDTDGKSNHFSRVGATSGAGGGLRGVDRVGGSLHRQDRGTAHDRRWNKVPGGSTTVPGGGTVRGDGTPPPPFSPSEPAFARLTAPQYANVIRDLFGAGIKIPELEPDQRPYLFSVIGASTTTVSEHGVDLYSQAALSIAKAAFTDTARRQTLVPCPVATPLDDACLGQFITQFGLRAWRRPLEPTEVHALPGARNEDRPRRSVGRSEYVTAAMLQSPNFLYRVELGEADASHPGWMRYTGYEMARAPLVPPAQQLPRRRALRGRREGRARDQGRDPRAGQSLARPTQRPPQR